MANISITARCNRDCDYCFAMSTLERLGSGVTHMSLETFSESLDFLQRSGITEARLLGGEPTIHPEFGAMVDEVRRRGLRLLVFSGGMIPEAALARLETMSVDDVSVLVNVIAPWEGNPAGEKRQQAVFNRLGRRVTPGLNIATPSVTFEFLVDLIERHGVARKIRLGIAHPTLGADNAYLHPGEYPEVGRRVTLFGLRAKALGISLQFDCGWVPCMFPDHALKALGKGPTEVGLRCSPILDILPDGNVISCYPLASHASTPLSRFRDTTSLESAFVGAQQGDRVVTLYKKCGTCHWRARGECTGGCLAGSLRRLRGSQTEWTNGGDAIHEHAGLVQLTVRPGGVAA